MPLPVAPAPFVLIDDARDEGAAPARLYRDPVEIVRADRLDDVAGALQSVRGARDRGLHAAGFMSYEAGFALEPRLARLGGTSPDANAPPLVWFGLFAGYESIDPAAVPALFPVPADIAIAPPQPLIDRARYGAAFSQVQNLIRAGDIYQANLSVACDVGVPDDIPALYGLIRPGAKAGHGALVMTGDHWVLSFSPELFFTLADDVVTTRPMKGTALRNADPVEDEAAAAALQNDPKQRAENLMIVDLLRNDLSRIAEPGSVAVPDLFAIERYPTVHQMTSTVTAKLRAGLSAVDIFCALFPCGSITGAPKLRAMEVIRDIEKRHRGVYTGSIGTFCADGSAQFNVAIRTICVKYGANTGQMGLGSGVVADSDVQNEWNECLDKGRFLGSVRTL